VRESAANLAGTARGSAANMAQTAREGAAQVAGTARQVAGSVRERASMVADTARERMAQAADTARYQADRVRSGYDHLVNEQPLALGAIGLAIGALLGAATPRTRQEDRLMGPARDRLADDLQEAAREPLERAVHAASAVADTAVEAFRSPSLSEGGASEKSDLTSSPSSPSSSQSSTQSSWPTSSASLGTSSGAGPGPLESGPGVTSPRGYSADGANTRSDVDAALGDKPSVGSDLTPPDDRRPGASLSDPPSGR
jgi:ElaB/YqjD/DUF883 family membrane-anchored ribosome-binding protein